MPIEGYNERPIAFEGIEAGGETLTPSRADPLLHLEAGDNVDINIDNGVVVISVPSVPAEDITGQLTHDQIASVDAASITEGKLTHEQIESVSAESIDGQITREQIASVDAASVEGEFTEDMRREITQEVVSSLPDAPQEVKDALAGVITEVINSGNDVQSAISRNFMPSCLSQNSATPTTYNPSQSGVSVMNGSAIAVPVAKKAIIFASMSVRRVLGIFDLFLVVNGARYRDIAVNVHGNDLDPRTHFTGFYVELLDDNLPTDFALGIDVQGDGASAVVDGYSLLIMWFGGEE